jgi:hypothetical protein
MMAGADDDAVIGFFQRFGQSRTSPGDCADSRSGELECRSPGAAVNGCSGIANKAELLAFSAPASAAVLTAMDLWPPVPVD